MNFINYYDFDQLNRQTGVIQEQQSGSGVDGVAYKWAGFSYDSGSRVTGIGTGPVFGGGSGSGSGSGSSGSGSGSGSGSISGSLYAVFNYDHANRLTDLTWRGLGGSHGTVSSGYGDYDRFQYAYNNDSQVSSFTATYFSSEYRDYTYDADGQLTGTGTGHTSYSWDLNGNPSGDTIGAGNRLLSDGTYAYTYDANGNMLSKKSSTAEVDYVWDQRNHLVAVKSYAVSSGVRGAQLQEVDYAYDALNRLADRTIKYFSGGAFREFPGGRGLLRIHRARQPSLKSLEPAEGQRLKTGWTQSPACRRSPPWP